MRMVEADCGGRAGCSRRREIVSVREGGFRRRRQWRSYGRSGAGRHSHGQSNPLGCDRLHLWRQSAARKRQRRRSWSMEQLRAGRLEGDKSRREKERSEQKNNKGNTKPSKSKRRGRKCGEKQICDHMHKFSMDGVLCWRTCCPQLLQPQSPACICAANTLLQPLPGSQTQNTLWKTSDFIP